MRVAMSMISKALQTWLYLKIFVIILDTFDMYCSLGGLAVGYVTMATIQRRSVGDQDATTVQQNGIQHVDNVDVPHDHWC